MFTRNFDFIHFHFITDSFFVFVGSRCVKLLSNFRESKFWDTRDKTVQKRSEKLSVFELSNFPLLIKKNSLNMNSSVDTMQLYDKMIPKVNSPC